MTWLLWLLVGALVAITVVRPALRTDRGKNRLMAACATLLILMGAITSTKAVIEMHRSGGALPEIRDVWFAGQAYPFYFFPILSAVGGLQIWLARRRASTATGITAAVFTVLALIVMAAQLGLVIEYGHGRSSGPAL